MQRTASLLLASSILVLLLWFPATSFGLQRTEQRASSRTVLASAGLLSRGAGYGTEHGSAAVRQLQLRLRRLGFRPGPLDGLFGPMTQRAVLRFQSARGLAHDGVVGPRTKKLLVARPVAREGTRTRAGRRERPAPERAAREHRAADPRPAAEAPPSPAPAPDSAATTPKPLRSDGLAPEVAAGLGALAMAVLLSGAILAGRRRARPIARSGGESERSPANGLRVGMVCAALLAVFAIGAAAGALFASHATTGDTEPNAASVEAILQSESAP